MALIRSYEIYHEIKRMPKEQVKGLLDAALDVAKGSKRPQLPEIARVVVQQIYALYPDLRA